MQNKIGTFLRRRVFKEKSNDSIYQLNSIKKL